MHDCRAKYLVNVKSVGKVAQMLVEVEEHIIGYDVTKWCVSRLLFNCNLCQISELADVTCLHWTQAQ